MGIFTFQSFNYLPNRPGEAQATLAGVSKIKADLGWRAEIDFMQWLREEVAL